MAGPNGLSPRQAGSIRAESMLAKCVTPERWKWAFKENADRTTKEALGLSTNKEVRPDGLP